MIQGGGDEDSELAMAAKYGYSMPIALIAKMMQKFYGYQRDGNVTEPLVQIAVKGTNALNDLIMQAPCVNRQGRWEEEEQQVKRWQRQIDKSGLDRIDAMLDRWGKADAFMLQAQIVEEERGYDASEPLYERYRECEAARAAAEMEASELKPAENSFFWCRVRQYRIERERTYDLATGRPVHDFTEVKREVAEGKDIHDLIHKVAWPGQESYRVITASQMDGVAFRELLMSLMAGLLPQNRQPQMPPWAGGGMMPWPGMMGGGGEEDQDGQQDDRKALLGVRFGKQKEQTPPQLRRSKRGSSR